MRYTLCFCIALLFITPLRGQHDARIPDPDPEIERKSFQVADGFEVNLFAADPLLAKPIHMNFDAAGRLWLACSETYPQIKPGHKANDKIIVLEDTKGAGKADKVTVFADGLLIPTGLEPGDGGVYVVNSTDLIHLSDPKGTGKATRRRVVLSGFGTEDTHHMVHSLRWGHDGNLYFNQSVYIHSHIETPHGVRRLNGGGVWQFRPDTLQLEVFLRGMWNSWGHHFDRWGQSFLTDGAGGEGVLIGFPGAIYNPSPGAVRTLHGLNIPSPKYCGLEIVSGRHLPPEWQGNLITNDFRAHRVCRFVLAPAGSGYTARLMPDVIKATHPAFRPIDVKMGPDGAIYVADWYNPIIQHGEVDFRDPRRDVTHGRIWRITAKGRPLVRRPKLISAKPDELVKCLAEPEGWTRHFARRVMQEHGGKAVLPSLQAWVGTLDPRKPENEPHLLEALWTYQALAVVEPKLLETLLSARDYRVRAAAVRVLSAWQDRVSNVLGLLEARVADEEPQVRLEAVRALARVPRVRSAELALRALDRPIDTNLDFGLWLTLRELQGQWLPALQAGTFDYGGNLRRLSFALQAVGSERVIGPLVALVRGGKLPKENEVSVLALLAAVGGPNELELVYKKAFAEKDDNRVIRLLTALEESTRQRGIRPAGGGKTVEGFINAGNDGATAVAARLAGLWGVEVARPKLNSLAHFANASLELRQAAIEGLASLGGPASKKTLGDLAERGDSQVVRRLALVALVGLDLPGAARRAHSVLSSGKNGEGAAEVFEAFLQRKNGAEELTKALGGKKLSPDVARVGVRTVRISGREARGLCDTLVNAGGLTFGAKVLSPKELKEMVANVARLGDAVRGEKIFRRPDQLCLRCHAIGGAGGQVGPDLSSIGASAQVDYLIESLLQPSKAIKENYHALLVSTVRGRQYTGIKVRQTPTSLILRTDQDKEIAIPLKDVDTQEPSKVSLMPDGLTDTLTRGELLDLVRFLSSLGKGERWSVGKERLTRRWQALPPTRELDNIVLARVAGAGIGDGEPGLEWTPAYSTVAGILPVGDLPRIGKSKDGPGVSLLRTQFDAAEACKVRLKLGAMKGLRVWLDGADVSPKEVVEVSLSRGLHTLTVLINHGERKDGLRLEVEDTPAAAGVRFVGGK
jgi:putative heme-binding domain-containing protein